MSGGLTRDPARHVEAFFTESNNSASCFLPDLPADRNFNTLDYIEGKLVLCGGDGERQNLLVSIVMHLNIFPTHENIFPYLVMPSQRHGLSCLHLTQVYEWSGWKELDPQGGEKVTLTEKRYSHTSWKSPGGYDTDHCLLKVDFETSGLLMIGGAGSPTTTEFVKTNIEEDPEEEEEEEDDKPKKPRNVYGFSMEHQVQDACGISVEDTYILTGGYNTRRYGPHCRWCTRDTCLPCARHVTMYNISGNFWELPQLNTGRWSHGCGYYVRESAAVSTDSCLVL